MSSVAPPAPLVTDAGTPVGAPASAWQPVGPRMVLGESPMWHPDEQVLWVCDIPGHRLHRLDPATGVHRDWAFDTDVACCAPMPGGELLLGMRDGLWRFDPSQGRRTRLATPPYDPAVERFNDGKADPLGRMWVGTIYEPREPAKAALYCLRDGELARQAGDITVSNGLGWSPDGRTQYWADTKSHTVFAFDVEPASGALSRRRVFARFPGKPADGSLDGYGGRPDGAAVDAQGCYWVAMFEGQRLLRLSPQGEVLSVWPLPARCPTMPCFGGADLRTLYVTTASERRPAAEREALPLTGHVLALRVDVPGLPVNFARA